MNSPWTPFVTNFIFSRLRPSPFCIIRSPLASLLAWASTARLLTISRATLKFLTWKMIILQLHILFIPNLNYLYSLHSYTPGITGSAESFHHSFCNFFPEKWKFVRITLCSEVNIKGLNFSNFFPTKPIIFEWMALNF